MIVFLTLIYVVVLFLAVKIGLIKLNSFWKISPVLWMLLLFFVLFVPMQWGAPAGAVRVYQSVIEIVPNVNGEVLEVPVRPLVRVREGDVLFTIDPIQYRAKVEQLEAQIALSSANLERAEDLMKRGVGRQLDVDIYAAEVNSLGAQLHNARWELAETEVRAPADDQFAPAQLDGLCARREHPLGGGYSAVAPAPCGARPASRGRDAHVSRPDILRNRRRDRADQRGSSATAQWCPASGAEPGRPGTAVRRGARARRRRPRPVQYSRRRCRHGCDLHGLGRGHPHHPQGHDADGGLDELPQGQCRKPT
jgi:hypothetical protein